MTVKILQSLRLASAAQILEGIVEVEILRQKAVAYYFQWYLQFGPSRPFALAD